MEQASMANFIQQEMMACLVRISFHPTYFVSVSEWGAKKFG